MTPLHEAHRYGNKTMIDLILSVHDGSENPVDWNGISHLHIACSRRDPKAVSRLIHHGAQANERVQLRAGATWSGRSSLEIALAYNRASIVCVLVRRARANLEEAIKRAVEHKLLGARSHRMIDRLLAEGLFRDPHLLLSHTCGKGYVGLVRVLLRHRANLGRPDGLLTSLKRAIERGHESIVGTLLDGGVRPNANTLVHLAMCQGRVRRTWTTRDVERYYHKVVTWFLEAGLDEDCINRALLRLHSSNIACLQVFLEHGTDVNLLDKNGKNVWAFLFDPSLSLDIYWDTCVLLRNHLLKLMIIGLPVSNENEWFFDMIQESIDKGSDTDEKQDSINFLTQCVQECNKLEQTRLSIYSSLRDVIFKDMTDMTVLVKNNSLKTLLTSDDLKKEYPLYGYLLKIQFRKGLLRRSLHESAQRSFQFITGQRLPDHCINEIFKYLYNDNLRYLTEVN